MIVRVKKITELPDALNPNNIQEGFEREFHHNYDNHFQPPTIGKRWWPDPTGDWSTSGMQEIIDDNTFKTYSSIYYWEIVKKEEESKLHVPLTLSILNDPLRFGLDGAHFEIALSKQLQPGDTITLNPELKISPLIVVEEPGRQYEASTLDGGSIVYWMHTVRLFNLETGRFFPGKYMRKGTTFNILK